MQAFVFCSCCCSEPVDTQVVEQDPGSAMEAAGRACRTGAHGTNLRSTAAAATTGIGSARKHKKKCKSGRHAKVRPGSRHALLTIHLSGDRKLLNRRVQTQRCELA